MCYSWWFCFWLKHDSPLNFLIFFHLLPFSTLDCNTMFLRSYSPPSIGLSILWTYSPHEHITFLKDEKYLKSKNPKVVFQLRYSHWNIRFFEMFSRRRHLHSECPCVFVNRPGPVKNPTLALAYERRSDVA